MNTIRQIENALIQILYFGCRVVAFPLLLVYFLYRCTRDGRYFRHFWERLGAEPSSFEPTASGAIWLHAVSVGEVVSAAHLVRELRIRDSDSPIYVSVGTVAGREIAEERLSELVSGVFYAPIDYAFAVRRVLGRVRPAVVIILETEIWPVLYREVKRTGASLLVVNGRISDRALPRYLRWRWLFRPVLALPEAIFVQSEQDRRRYLSIGAPDQKIEVLVNLKYDAAPPDKSPPKLITDVLKRLNPSIVWVAASTMPGIDGSDLDEDDAVIDAFKELSPRHPGLLLILVPRRPERFETAEERLREAGLRYVRRSSNRIDPAQPPPNIILLDSIGELASLFPVADVVFMGGSLARRGGHNVLEPAVCGRAIVVGPHMENFAAIAREFREQNAMLEIQTAGELAAAVDRLIADADLRKDLGARASGVAQQRRGATAKAAAAILHWRDLAVPQYQPHGPMRPLLWVLARLWSVASRIVQRRDARRARHLNTPVVSIGGISMGGSGKTPMANLLAGRLRELGLQPAILTRGYRRQSFDKSIVVQAGHKLPVSATGDEAQIFMRSGYAHTGIGSDRWATGRLVEEKLSPDVFLLDDGFQHRRLARDLDIVLIDALNPFAGGDLFPLGWLREPLRALGRADAFVITRAAPEREYQGIRERLRAWNATAPIFRARVLPLYWVNARTQRPRHPEEGPTAAFCGLANPRSFWATLRTLRIRPSFTWAFDDHHSYNCIELQRLAAQARMHGSSVLLTTEKDAMNLPEHAAEILVEASVELYWLRIAIQVDDEKRLLELIQSKLTK